MKSLRPRRSPDGVSEFRVSQRYQHVLDKVDSAHAPALDWNFKRNLVDI
jgi:hypothetical protein